VPAGIKDHLSRTKNRIQRDLVRLQGGRSIVAIDLGEATSRAVHLLRDGDQTTLVSSVSLPSPLAAGEWDDQKLAEHFTEIHRLLGAKTKRTVIALPTKDTVLRVTEMADAPEADLRGVLRYNSARYLQQDLKNHVFDCCILQAAPPESSRQTASMQQVIEADFGDGKVAAPIAPDAIAPGKRKYVLAGGLPADRLRKVSAAAAQAGLVLENVTIAQVSLVQAGLAARLSKNEQEVFGFLDIRPGQTTLSVVMNGEMAFTRTIATGSGTITHLLAGSLNITPQVAEGLIMTMPEKVREKLLKAIFPLVEEVRTSIDFFEEQRQKVVSRLYVSGAESKTDLLFQLLREELAAPVCERWSPAACVAQAGVDQPGADLTGYGAAIGAGAAILGGGRTWINLLGEEQDHEESQIRDPVRWIWFAAGCLALVLLAATGILKLWVNATHHEIGQTQDYLAEMEGVRQSVTAYSAKAREHEKVLGSLYRQASDRFLWALPLNALQAAVVPEVTVARIQMRQTVAFTPAVKSDTDIDGTVFAGKPAFTIEKTSLLISAKDFGEPPAAEKFISAIASEPYFQDRLRAANPIILRDRLPRHVDRDGSSQSYIPFTIECVFTERKVVDE
jgi:Tfp pilus assembly PilM family ATPase